ncbi:hypothetical protein DNTS_006288 [Danionella cerebrum]|uniref:Reticulon n=1 Tax=Danionella cerebrum TaxID=2873325 RepID=A0A553Q211_9TELE|nr:hypothetical protein DNTS_006288 [Danionella translucida]
MIHEAQLLQSEQLSLGGAVSWRGSEEERKTSSSALQRDECTSSTQPEGADWMGPACVVTLYLCALHLHEAGAVYRCGNEESDYPELQTAREWSDDDIGADDDEGLDDDDESCLSSSSIWGTPRQNSFELTFSYIAFAENDSPLRRDSGRRRTALKSGRGSQLHTELPETPAPLDSPAAEWDPQSFLNVEDEERSGTGTHEAQRNMMEDFLEKDTGTGGATKEISGILTHSHHRKEQLTVPQLPGSDPTVATETTPTHQMVNKSHVTASAIGCNTQEELICKQRHSTISQSEEPTTHIQFAVMELIFWKDMEKTGLVFTGLVVTLLSLFQLSIISVISMLSLGLMCCTISVRIYYSLLHALQLGDGVHPFQTYLDLDISLKEEAQQTLQRVIVLSCSALDTVRNLVFVANLFNSLKFWLLMYLVTFLGNLCNGLTLLIIGVIAVFSVPLFYTRHQDKVDHCIGAVQGKIDNLKDFIHRLAQGGGPPQDPTPGGAKPKTH